MKVWVLTYQEYDDFEVVGVYRTKRRAQQMIGWAIRHGGPPYRRNRRFFEIGEERLDGWPFRPEQMKDLKLPRWVK